MAKNYRIILEKSLIFNQLKTLDYDSRKNVVGQRNSHQKR